MICALICFMRKLLRAGLVICLASALMLFPVGATTFQPQQGSASSSSSTTGYQTPTPSVTVGVNWTAFYGSQPILISGTVGPLSPPIMEVLVSVDSYDAPVSIASVPVNDSTGLRAPTASPPPTPTSGRSRAPRPTSSIPPVRRPWVPRHHRPRPLPPVLRSTASRPASP